MLECIGYASNMHMHIMHTGTGNSHPDMDEHRLLHDRFMSDMYKDEYFFQIKFQI
jgi:hypothetical protein